MGTATHAEFTMKDITDQKYEKDAPTYVSGLYAEMTWYNTMLRQANETTLFCEPQDRFLTNDKVTEIILRFASTLDTVEENTKTMSYPVDVVLLRALKHEFPCAPQNHAQISPVCKMTDIEANSSPNCIRYYFSCKGAPSQGCSMLSTESPMQQF